MAPKLAVGLVLSALLVYGTIEALPLILGPSLTLEAPADGARIEGGIVAIRGTALRATALTLNGAPLLGDERGAFSTTLAYAQGTSILTLTAKDRFGRTITTTRTIYIP